MGVIDPTFKNNVKKNAKPFVNFVWFLVIAAILMGLAAKFIWSGYPPAIAWLEPWFEMVGIVGVLGVALLVADKNPLIRG